MNKNKIFFWLEIFFYLLIAYLPFQIALNPAPDIDLLSGRVLILGLFFLWLIIAWQFGRLTKPAGPTAWGLILFFVISLISFLVAENQIWASRKILVFTSIFPLYFLTAGLINQEDKIKKAWRIIVGGAVLTSFIALGQFLSQFVFNLEKIMVFWAEKITPFFLGRTFSQLVIGNPSWLVEVKGQTLLRAIGLFPDPHMLAFYLGLIFPLSFSLLIFSKQYKAMWFAINCLLLIVFCLTFSRGGYLGLLASGALMVSLVWQQLAKKTKKFIGSGLLLLITCLFLWGGSITGRLVSSFDLGEGSNLGRLAVWRESFSVVRESPLLGVGLGNYPLALNPTEAYRSAVTSHNLYLDIWAELGVFGLLTWCFLIGGALFLAARNFYRQIGEAKMFSLGVAGSLVYFSVHSFFETAIFNPTILAFLMVILGLNNVYLVSKSN